MHCADGTPCDKMLLTSNMAYKHFSSHTDKSPNLRYRSHVSWGIIIIEHVEILSAAKNLTL